MVAVQAWSRDERSRIFGRMYASWVLTRHPGDSRAGAKVRKRAAYKNIRGEWPAWGRRFSPGQSCDAAIEEEAMRHFRNWAAQEGIRKKEG